jgi:uncharacterized membrane protein YphA (DoxX/SURF4 family)
MKTSDLDFWAQSHFDYFMDAVRIYLGVGLLVKGISLLTNHDALASVDGTALAPLAPMVPYAHLLGGALLALGILPRLAALVNIPILFAAVSLVHAPQLHTIRGREGFEFSALVLFLLCLIAVKGAGRLAVSATWRSGPRERLGHSLQRWVDEHPDIFADLIRIYLGVGLFVKGMYIMDHREEMMQMLNGGSNMSLTMVAAAHYVIPAHFVGGTLLMFGILTRLAAAAQIPALLGAIFYVFLPRFSALEMRQSFEFTTLVLFLLALITVFGAGRWSVEHAGRKMLAYGPQLQPIH